MSTKGKKHKFEWNSKYFTISIYSIFVIVIGCIIFRIVFDLAVTLDIIKRFIGVMSPFLVGLLIAYMMNPFINLFYNSLFKKKLHVKRKKFFKILSIVLSYMIVLGILGICLTFVIPQVINSIAELTTSIPDIYNSIMDKVNNLTKRGQNLSTPGAINVFLNQNLPKVYNYLETFMGKSIPMLYDLSMQAIKMVFNIFIAVIISIYLSLDKKILLNAGKRFIYASFTTSQARNFILTLKECNQIFSRYLSGKAIDSLIIGILCFILMTFLNLPLTVLISLIVGVTNMIPYFGPFIGAIPGIFLTAIISPYAGIKFGIMVFLLQQFDGYILGPKILGNSTGVRPISILLAIIVGGAYFGAVGMFLGVPVFAVIQYLIGKWMDERLKKKEIELEA
ncbi:MAG: AI-2E family transporter [Lachnospiraceae bacterium]|nr:AI-2E family transporter [Lachnospiraceae bacterium]